jgi:glycosyltransferase involved in cell wall biosynthesis
VTRSHRRRILTIAACPFPAGRGSQLLIERTTQGLIERGHQVELLTARAAEPGRTTRLEVRRAGLPALGCGGPIESRVTLRRAVDDALILIAAMRQKPQVLIGHNLEGGLIAGLVGRLLGLPVVWVRHSDFADELALRSRWPALTRRLVAAPERWAGRLATRVVLLGPPGHPEQRVDCIPPPLDPDDPRIEPADGHTLYYEGNLDPYQNPGWLDLALTRARERHPDARLVVAAGPAERPAGADLALVPRTLAGGFPMKLLAHQVAGVPALCTERGAPGMLDGLDAFTLPGTPTAEQFARRAAELLDQPKRLRELRRSARERAFRRSAPEIVAEQLESCLERAIRDHGADADRRANAGRRA